MEGKKRKKGKNLTAKQKDLIVNVMMDPESFKLSQDDLSNKINNALWHYHHRKLSVKYLKKKLIPELKKKLPEEKAWCIGSNEDIPLWAMPAVLGASKQAQIIGRSLSIREAKWCAMLSSLISDSRTLLSVASGYASRERTHEVIDKPGESFDTSNLDRILTMTPWELATACLTEEIKPIGPSVTKWDVEPKKLSIFDTAVPYEPMTIFESLKTIEIAPDILETQADDAQISFIFSTPWSSVDLWAIIFRRLPVQKELFRDIHISMRKTLHELNFSQEQMRVYTMCLKYMAAGPRVQKLQERQVKSRVKMVDELREWVKNHDLAKDSRILLPLSPEWPAIEDKIWKYNLMPFELLKKVGYKV